MSCNGHLDWCLTPTVMNIIIREENEAHTTHKHVFAGLL